MGQSWLQEGHKKGRNSSRGRDFLETADVFVNHNVRNNDLRIYLLPVSKRRGTFSFIICNTTI